MAHEWKPFGSPTYSLYLLTYPRGLIMMRHRYVNRTQPIITDSGGFQVFSLSHGSVHDELNMKARKSQTKNGGTWAPSVVKVTEEGATFRSYIDGEPSFSFPRREWKLGKSLVPVRAPLAIRRRGFVPLSARTRAAARTAH